MASRSLKKRHLTPKPTPLTPDARAVYLPGGSESRLTEHADSSTAPPQTDDTKSMETMNTATLTEMTRSARSQATRERAATILRARRLAALGDRIASDLLLGSL